MTNPTIKYCPAGTWTKVATSVTSGVIKKMDLNPFLYLETYRVAGDPAPTSRLEGHPCFVFGDITISTDFPVDVYIMPINSAGEVRYDSGRNSIIDPLTSAIVDIDYNHHKIHEGDHYLFSRFIALASLATVNYVLTVGSKPVHFVYAIDSDVAGFTFSSYRNVTFTADTGTVLPLLNNNSGSTKTTEAVLRQNPTAFSTVGATLYRNASKGTATNPAKSSAGSVSRDDEVILSPGEKWSITITNKASSENPINVSLSFYEHEADN